MKGIKEKMSEEEYVICPLCFPPYVYCDENCKECETNIEFEKWCKENLKDE